MIEPKPDPEDFTIRCSKFSNPPQLATPSSHPARFPPMKLILLIFAAVLGCSSTGLLHAETDTNTEVRVLPRTRPDRLYQLTIALPPSFREHPDRKYPVILVVEGYWGLAHTAYLAGLPASKLRRNRRGFAHGFHPA